MYSRITIPFEQQKRAFPSYMVEQLTIDDLMNLFGQSELSLEKATLLKEKLGEAWGYDISYNGGYRGNQNKLASPEGIIKTEISKAILDDTISVESFKEIFPKEVYIDTI